MLNFYSLYNKTGLDKEEEYALLISALINEIYIMDDMTAIKHIIKKSPKYAYRYAAFILKERWIEAEAVIMKSPQYAFYYARSIIEGRWKEAEPYILTDAYWNVYCKWFNIC